MSAQRDNRTAVSLVLTAVVSVQFGSALATTVFDEVGPIGTVALRLVFAALILAAIWRPALSDLRGSRGRDVVLFAISLAGMNTAFYSSLDRIPLGIAVTLEFVGPLAVAFAFSRRRTDLLWAGLAALGIVLLSPGLGDGLDLLGAALALLAGAFWAAYILLSSRIGREFSGGGGLALAMGVAALAVLVPGIAVAGSDLLDPAVLAAGLGVAIVSSVIPYSLELEALRRLARATFGVLMSLEPAVAAAVGFLTLGQDLEPTEIVAIVLVVVASAGALRWAPAVAEA